jgi:aspartyl protease
MSTPFRLSGGLITVPGGLGGPVGSFSLTWAVDTGAGQTSIEASILAAAGYDPSQWGSPQSILTATGTTTAHPLTVHYLRALGWRRDHMPILALTLPARLRVHGLLGLDFFRDHVLTIDFLHNDIDMSPGPSASVTP